MRYLVLLSCLLVGSVLMGTARAEKPNIVLIMCDDLGWGDVGFNGGTHIRTPHLDAMAESGMKLTRFYAQAPVCSPTRASVVTGRHHDRMGIYSANQGHMRDGEFTLYEALAKQGYATGHFGKWHMGTLTRKINDSNRGARKPEHYSPPWQHDVDATFATEAKTPTYDPMWKPARAKGGPPFTSASRDGWHAIPEDAEKELYGTYYWTAEETRVDPESDELLGDDSELIMDRAIDFINQNRQQPFLAIVWFHAPHLPVVASREDAKSYDDDTTDGYQQNYYGCVTALDRQVGRLRDHLRQHNIADNTLVAFCSDNGPEGNNSAPGQQGPYRGRKRSLYEGGVRVPGLLEWPARIQPGSVSDVATCTVDYFPTIRDIVGFKMPDDRPLDGISLLPLIEGKMKQRPTPLAFHHRGKAAWHAGHWKAVRDGGKNEWELYNLQDDAAEKNNLAEHHQQRLETMVRDWTNWKESVDASDQGADYPVR